jgi:hypothetical protein
MDCDDEGSIPSRPPTEITTPTKEVEIMSIIHEVAKFGTPDYLVWVDTINNESAVVLCPRCEGLSRQLDGQIVCDTCLSEFYLVEASKIERVIPDSYFDLDGE